MAASGLKWATVFSWVPLSSLSLALGYFFLFWGLGEEGGGRHRRGWWFVSQLVNHAWLIAFSGSPATTHRNISSSSMNDISDKPEKDQVSLFTLFTHIIPSLPSRMAAIPLDKGRWEIRSSLLNPPFIPYRVPSPYPHQTCFQIKLQNASAFILATS